jgi:hypothetical protein
MLIRNIRIGVVVGVAALSLAACNGSGSAASGASSAEHAIATNSADQQAAKDIASKCMNVSSLGDVVNALDTKAKRAAVEAKCKIPPQNDAAFRTAVTNSAVSTYNANHAAVKAKHTTWTIVFKNWSTDTLPLIIQKYQS